MKSKKGIIITTIVVLLLLVVGVTYAFFTYESGTKSDIVTGQIYMNYEETSTISLTGVFPETKEQALARQDENGVFEFTITGRNTSKYPVYYEIDLLEGGVITGKTEQSTKILPEHVMIYLEKDGVPVIEGETYADFNNRRIYTETIPANQTSNIEHKYTLRMWIDENVTISDTDPNADYTTSEWNDAYTSLKVRVVGDFEEKTMPLPATEALIKKIGTSGFVAVATDGTLYTDETTQTLRDYRFSGSNDVVTNNYVWFNDELWRIIGIMPTEKEDGTTENLMKIIKATPLTIEEIPATYTYNGIEMTLRLIDEYNSAVWNYSKYFGQSNPNNWTKAAVQYFLNDETEGSSSYYNSIDSTYQAMIQKSVYKLGNVTDGSTNTPLNSYTEERSENVRYGNEKTWTGKIGLMYPSDYGYAADSTYWTTSMWSYDSIAKNYDWLYDGINSLWTISPGAGYSNSVLCAESMGYVAEVGAYNVSREISPVLYLKSDVMISGGEGTSLVPYELSF